MLRECHWKITESVFSSAKLNDTAKYLIALDEVDSDVDNFVEAATSDEDTSGLEDCRGIFNEGLKENNKKANILEKILAFFI